MQVSSLCLTYDPSNGKCLTCNSGSALNAGVCSSISAPIINCLIQVGSVCSVCQDRYYLSSNLCLQVSPLCVTYDSANGNCLSCNTDESLENGYCISISDPIPNCLIQAADSCSSCKNRFYLSSNTCLQVSPLCVNYDSTNGKCLSCNTGETLTAGACISTSAPISNCLIQAAGTCSVCKDRYYLSSNSCLQVSPFCLNYDSTNGKCLSCGIEETLAAGICFSSSNPVPNCLTQSGSACLSCKDRYYLSFDSCFQVSPFCL